MGERHAEQRRLSPRRPGPYRQRQKIKARFVSPDDGRSLFVRPFFRVGQRSSYHVAILASLRCVARVMGR